MSDEQMRIAIAEACGFYDFGTKAFLSGDTALVARLKPGSKPPFNWEPWVDGRYSVLDYPADLNACHEMEGTLDLNQRDEYVRHLRRLVPIGLDADDDYFLVIHATARQRCEAFLRTIGKWKEGQ